MLNYLKTRANAIAIAISIGAWITATTVLSFKGWDWLHSFRPASLGSFQLMVIPYWGLFLSWIPAHLPEPFGFGLWTGVGLLLVILAARYTRAPLPAVLLSYQFIWILYYGQIDGYVIFGIIMGLWAVRTSRPGWLGVALMTALIKPQYGLLPALMLFWWSPNKKKTFLVAGLIGAASLVAWPTWIFDLIQNQWVSFLSRQETIRSNTSPGFPWALSLLLVLLAFSVRLEKKQKLTVLLATSMLVSPYAPIYCQAALLVIGLPRIFYIFAFIPWAVAIFLGPYGHWGWGYIFPLSVWLYLVVPALWPVIQRRFLPIVKRAHPA
jgi:hypothetical protein